MSIRLINQALKDTRQKRVRFYPMTDCIFIIFGATGDLTKRKLIPALYKLVQDNKVEKFAIIGAAIDAIDADEIIERARNFVPNIDETIWQRLKKNTYYQQVNFNTSSDFDALARYINQIEKEHNLSGNRLAYMAVASNFFCMITQEIGRTGVIKRDGKNRTWQRIAYEKPFGTSAQSAHEINTCIKQWFNEEQIYRIDHYLTKELVSNITLVRFTNIVFEPLWNNKYIDYVQIIMDESVGLEGRGRYYDQYGVLKDVIQNHALQLISLVAMELPKQLRSRFIHDEKAAVLQRIRFEDGFLGQYTDYTSEPDVAPDSQTPTFACLRLAIDSPRWEAVPFYIKAGKKMNKKNTSIYIKFKDVACDVSPYCIYESNVLNIQIDPDSRFSLQLNTKKPGPTLDVTPVQLSFSRNYVFGTLTPEAYEILLEQIMAGDQAISVQADEIEYSWNVIEHIESHKLPEYTYQPNSFGPLQLETFAQKYKFKWLA
jgi:glucose-6-phosphate 1-dehydrogenase